MSNCKMKFEIQINKCWATVIKHTRIVRNDLKPLENKHNKGETERLNLTWRNKVIQNGQMQGEYARIAPATRVFFQPYQDGFGYVKECVKNIRAEYTT